MGKINLLVIEFWCNCLIFCKLSDLLGYKVYFSDYFDWWWFICYEEGIDFEI